MTKEEVYKLIFVIKSVYPKTYEKFTASDFDNMALGWFMALEDYSYQEISVATKAYITTNTSGFPPVPAQLIAYTQERDPVKEMSSAEAWDLVYKAISRSIYYAEEEFDKLPELCKKAIGSPANLRELAQLDPRTVQGVEGSHFKRNYEELVKRQREYNKVPKSTRARLEAIQSKILLEG